MPTHYLLPVDHDPFKPGIQGKSEDDGGDLAPVRSSSLRPLSRAPGSTVLFGAPQEDIEARAFTDRTGFEHIPFANTGLGLAAYTMAPGVAARRMIEEGINTSIDWLRATHQMDGAKATDLFVRPREGDAADIIENPNSVNVSAPLAPLGLASMGNPASALGRESLRSGAKVGRPTLDPLEGWGQFRQEIVKAMGKDPDGSADIVMPESRQALFEAWQANGGNLSAAREQYRNRPTQTPDVEAPSTEPKSFYDHWGMGKGDKLLADQQRSSLPGMIGNAVERGGLSGEAGQIFRQMYEAGEPLMEIAKRLGVDPQVLKSNQARFLLGGDEISRGGFIRGREEEFAELWRSGAPRSEIADYFGIAPKTVSNTRMALGLEPRPGQIPNEAELLDEVRALRFEGLSYTEVGDKLGISKGTVAGIIKRLRDSGTAVLSDQSRSSLPGAVGNALDQGAGSSAARMEKVTPALSEAQAKLSEKLTKDFGETPLGDPPTQALRQTGKDTFDIPPNFRTEGDERPVMSATRFGDKVYAGRMHVQAYENAVADLGQANVDALARSLTKDDEGFITNKGRYVDRREAAKLEGFRSLLGFQEKWIAGEGIDARNQELYKRRSDRSSGAANASESLKRVDVSVQKNPGFRDQWRAENENGWVSASADPGQKLVTIHAASLKGGAVPGQGHGTALYRSIIDKALADGYTVESSRAVSREARNLYEGLRRKGYVLETINPEGMKGDKAPVYRIIGRGDRSSGAASDSGDLKAATGIPAPGDGGDDGERRIYLVPVDHNPFKKMGGVPERPREPSISYPSEEDRQRAEFDSRLRFLHERDAAMPQSNWAPWSRSPDGSNMPSRDPYEVWDHNNRMLGRQPQRTRRDF